MSSGCVKIAYQSKEAAISDIRHMRSVQVHFRKFHDKKANKQKRPYLCHKCNFWHTTTMPKAIEKRLFKGAMS